MYSEEQTDQNPVVENIQEEKTEKTEQPEMKKEAPQQISKEEKEEISNLLVDEKTESTDEIQTESPPPQINESEKESIVDLLSDKNQPSDSKEDMKEVDHLIVDKEPESANDTQKETVVQQIDDREKESIVNLLNDVQQPIDSPEVPEEVVTDTKQITEGERNEIILLLHDGDISSVAEPYVEVEIDFEQLNKQELVEMLEEVVEEKDINKIKNKIGKIKTAFHHRNKEEIDKAREAFITEGGNKDDFKHSEDPLEKRFNAAFGKYRYNKAKNAEDVEKQKLENLQVKFSILEELKALINSEETLKKTYDEFRHLQDRWKEIGMVPAGELNNLWQNYHFLVEMFFDKVRINKELRDLDLKKNLEKKIQICEKAEELLLENSLIRSFKLLQKYHDEWREVGPVPLDKKDELWDRFKAATDKINERRREYYKDIQEEQERNYEAKLGLCDKVEEVETNSEDSLRIWQKKTDQVNELFKVWKTIGRAPKAKNDEIWKRFRGAMDTFFNSKREFLGKLKDQQTENLNLKIDLCAKAESIKDSTDWRKTSQELINLQKEWKNVGPVPRRHSEKVWKRFRSACDEFFNNKSEFYKNIHGVEKDNLDGKEALIKEISAFKVVKDKSTNLDALKSFQRKWMETGHVPYKDKDRVQKEYRKAIDQLIDKMDINRMELSRSGYEERIEIMKNDPDAGRMLSRERAGLQNKIKAVADEINLWENNISFFASSKKSEQLKQEFEKKIEKAKLELENMRTNLRMLN